MTIMVVIMTMVMNLKRGFNEKTKCSLKNYSLEYKEIQYKRGLSSNGKTRK